MKQDYVDRLKQAISMERERASGINKDIEGVTEEIAALKVRIRSLQDEYATKGDKAALGSIEEAHSEIEKLERKKVYMQTCMKQKAVKLNDNPQKIFDKVMKDLAIAEKKQRILETNKGFLEAIKEYNDAMGEFKEIVAGIRRVENQVNDEYLEEIVRIMRECSSMFSASDILNNSDIKVGASAVEEIWKEHRSLSNMVFGFSV
jgi:DNA-binding ferritin-like protein